MKTLLWTNRVFLTLLSISTGTVKLIKIDEEMEIFRVAGFADEATIAFGVVQLVLGLLLLHPMTTRRAAWGMAGTFTLATGVLLINGMLSFFFVSFLFIASAAVHAKFWPPFGPESTSPAA